MIGIVVVTHGRVAEELVNAARTIVGELPAVAAVSIGWTDDPAAANGAIQRGLQEVGGGDALVLTDMFGGTPTNLSLPFLSENEVLAKRTT
jgi:PTS system mannose-specific IIA component